MGIRRYLLTKPVLHLGMIIVNPVLESPTIIVIGMKVPSSCIRMDHGMMGRYIRRLFI